MPSPPRIDGSANDPELNYQPTTGNASQFVKFLLTNVLVNSLSHLTAVAGGISKLLKATANAVLRVSSEGSEEVPFLQGANGEMTSLSTVYGSEDEPILQLASGAVVNLPVYLCRSATGNGTIMQPGTTALDFTTAKKRLICFVFVSGGTDTFCWVNTSDDGSAKIRTCGVATTTRELITMCDTRYCLMSSTTLNNIAWVAYWDLE